MPPSPTQQPQSVLFDPALNQAFPAYLTDPYTLPTEFADPPVLPPPLSATPPSNPDQVVKDAIDNITAVWEGSGTECARCKMGLQASKRLAQVLPEKAPVAIAAFCETTGMGSHDSCAGVYSANGMGATWTQVLVYADVTGQDGDYICKHLGHFCPEPPPNKLDAAALFPKPKPANATASAASGQRVKVLHHSDIHLDPRYLVGSETNCTDGLCCRSNSLPATLYGNYHCDTPYNLLSAALDSVGPLAGVSANQSFAWTIFTGDMVCHESRVQLSRAFTEY
jgi:hypothetical protein